MNKVLKLRSILSIYIIISLLLSITPGFAFAANTGDIKEQLSVVVQGGFGPVARNTCVTGMTQDDTGNIYVVGVTKSQFGEKDANDTRERVFLAKFDEDLEMVDYTVLIGDAPEIISYEGYDFAKEEKVYYAGNEFHNSPITVDEDGYIYIVTQEKVSRELTTSIEDIMYDFPDDCICWMWCDEYDCDFGETTDCPVCNAFREFEATFKEGSSLEYVLYKFDSSLEEKDKFIIASVQGANPYNSRTIAIEIDDDGNIYVGGGTEKDLGFADPVYDFNYFDADPTGSGKKMVDTRGFLVKINPSMTRITASTYLGGPLAETQWSSGPNCYVTAIAADGGYIYVAGTDGGGKIPTVAGNVYEEKTKNDSDVYIVRFNKDDLSIDRATYFGGTSSDNVSQLTVTGAVYSGMVYIGGHTDSPTIPTHSSAYQRSLNTSTGNYSDAFVARFSKSLEIDDSFVATYVGGTNREDLFGMDVDDVGNVYITGETYGAYDYPTTDGTSTGRIFITKLNNDFSRLIASTTVGAVPWSGDEQGRAIIAREDGIIVAGQGDFENTDIARSFVSKYNTTLSHSRVLEIKATPSGTSRNPVYLGTDDVIDIEVIFNSYVVVDTTNGTPRIKLNMEEDSCAYYVSGSGTNTLEFQYTIVEGDTTNGAPLSCDESALDLNGGTILPRSGGTSEDLNLTLPSDDLAGEYIYINTIPVKVDLISSSIGKGTYGVDTIIPITVRFEDKISSVDTTNGTPELLLNNGGRAVFVQKSKNRDTDLSFHYTVEEGQTADELNIASENALTLNGAVIKDYYGIEPDLTLPSPNDEQRTLKGKGINIDSNAARILSVTTTLEEGAYTVGQEIPITLNFDKPINKTGAISLSINSKKDYGMISNDEDIQNVQSITFNYVVGEGDSTEGYIDYTNEFLVIQEGAQLTSADGSPVSITMPKPGSENSLSSAKIMIDTEAPFIKYCYKKPTSVSIFKAGDEIILEAEFNEEVYLEGAVTPYVEVSYTTPGEENPARFEYIGMDPEDPKTAWFKYTVKEQDSLKNERIDYVGWTIALEGCFIDKAGNKALLELPYNTSSWITPTWKLTFDTVSPTWGDGTITLTYDEEEKAVIVEWPDAGEDNSGINRYYIYRAVEGKEEQELGYKNSYTKSYEDSAIVSGTTYIYSVYAEDKAGNRSEALSEEITIPGDKPIEDTLPPYWASGAELIGERLSSTKAKLSWNPAMAVDEDGEIEKLEIYQKIDNTWDTKPIVVISGEDLYTVKEYIVEGITNTDYEFGIFIVDGARHKSEPLTAVIQREDAVMAVVDTKTQTIKKEYLLGDLVEMETENIRYSGLSYKDGDFYRSWYGATGITLETILEDLGVLESYTRMGFQASNMAGPFTLTKEQIEGEQCYFAGSPENKISVKPMIALYYSRREGFYLEPPFIEDPSQIPDGFQVGAGPRLFFGQTEYNDPNRSNFVSDVYYIYVDFLEDPHYHEKPTIHNVTEDDLYIEVGGTVPVDEFPERYNVIATDAYGIRISENNITRKIVLESESDKVLSRIDTTKPGIHLVTYTAKDIRGNVAVVTKRVIIYKPIVPKGIYSVGIDESGEYEIIQDSQVPTIVSIVDEEKEIEFSANISPVISYDEGSLAVLFTHMRGNKMIGMSLIEGQDLTANTPVNGSFVMKRGDKVLIYVVDKIDGLKGSGTNILFE